MLNAKRVVMHLAFSVQHTGRICMQIFCYTFDTDSMENQTKLRHRCNGRQKHSPGN